MWNLFSKDARNNVFISFIFLNSLMSQTGGSGVDHDMRCDAIDLYICSSYIIRLLQIWRVSAQKA